MAKMVRNDLSGILTELPKISELRFDRTGNSADLFICALGFEKRSLAIPEAVSREKISIGRSIYLTYATNKSDNLSNLSQLEAFLDENSRNVRSLEADLPDFSHRLREAIELIASEANPHIPKVLFDISVCANRLILKCLKVLLEYKIELTVVYSEAAVYHPTEFEYKLNAETWSGGDSLGLERGVGSIETSIDYPGYHLDQLPDLLVLFPSFKGERSKAVISAVDPSLLTNPGRKVYWLLGVPHLTEDRWRVNAMRMINGIPENSPQIEVDTFNYKNTLEILESIYMETGEKYNITISPLGSKMQAVGTALFCCLHPDVRIMFATPREYNATQYSEGSKALWRIEFGRTDNLINLLKRVGKIAILD